MPREKLKQRADGRFRCKYDGQYFYGRTQGEAIATREEYKKLKQTGLRMESAGVTIREYATSWATIHKADVSSKTYNGYVCQLEKFIRVIGDKRMKEVTASDIKLAYNSVSELSASSIHLFSVTITALFRSAVADRIIIHNPCASVKPPKGASGTHRAIAKEERDLIHATEHRLRPAVMVMLYAGLRRGEVLALNIERDIDFKAKTVTVREAVRFESNQPIIGDPKTEAGVRTIPMLDILAEELHGKSGLVAPSADGKLMSDVAFRRAWDGYLTALSITHNGFTRRWPKKDAKGELLPFAEVVIRPHDLRHSYCTMLYDAGVDLKTAMKWMGHADQTMTMKVYTHLSEEREQAATTALAQSVNNMLGGQLRGQNKN